MASNMLTMEDGHELPTEAQRPVDRDGGGGLEAGGGGRKRPRGAGAIGGRIGGPKVLGGGGA